MVSTRPRLNTAQLRRKRINNNEDNAFMVKTGRQIMVSTVIALLVFAVSKIQNPVCTNITSTVKNILVYTVDYKKAAIEIYSQIKSHGPFQPAGRKYSAIGQQRRYKRKPKQQRGKCP